MRKLILLFVFTAIVSCNSNKMNGVYVYEEPAEEKASTNFFDLAGAAESGRQIGCSMIGQFEFKDSKCYFKIMGAEQRADYEIDNGVIYLGSNALTNSGIGLKIIDENTIDYMGCTFRKEGTSKTEQVKTE